MLYRSSYDCYIFVDQDSRIGGERKRVDDPPIPNPLKDNQFQGKKKQGG